MCAAVAACSTAGAVCLECDDWVLSHKAREGVIIAGFLRPDIRLKPCIDSFLQTRSKRVIKKQIFNKV